MAQYECPEPGCGEEQIPVTAMGDEVKMGVCPNQHERPLTRKR